MSSKTIDNFKEILSIDEIFENSSDKSHVDIAIELFKKYVPDWSKIDYIDGSPRCHEEMNRYIKERYKTFDRMKGNNGKGSKYWDKHGFVSYKALNAWKVSTYNCKIYYLSD